jgi:hypothetical protein
MGRIYEPDPLGQWERFTRLVSAWHAATRHELWNSARLFENKLHLMGAWRDCGGLWHIGQGHELPRK